MGVGGERHAPTALSPGVKDTLLIAQIINTLFRIRIQFYLITLNINRAEEIDSLLRGMFVWPSKKLVSLFTPIKKMLQNPKSELLEFYVLR
jgi:hypothetical protein